VEPRALVCWMEYWFPHKNRVMKQSGIVVDPSIGQIEYWKYLQGAPGGVLPSCNVIEIEVNDPDIEAMEKAVSFFIRRHESVRTIFPAIDGEVKQMVMPDDDERFRVEFFDISTFRPPYTDIKIEHLKRLASVFFNVQTGPLIKFILFKQASDFNFYVLIHHIICDDWSVNIIRTELITFYHSYTKKKVPDIPPLKAQLRDYCSRQNSWLRENREELKRSWKDKLADYDTIFNTRLFNEKYFLRHNKRSLLAMSTESITIEELRAIYNDPTAILYAFTIPKARYDKIRKLAEVAQCSVAAIVYASLYILLYYYTGKKNLLFAALVADRFVPEHHFLIGCLLGATYFPREISAGLIVRDLIHDVLLDIAENCKNIIPSHDYLELDSIKYQLSCDLYINYIRRNNETPSSMFSDRKHTEIPGGISYPFNFAIYEYNDGLGFDCKYNKQLFTNGLMEDFLKCYEDILDYMTTNYDKTIEGLLSSLEIKRTMQA
jgi:Condensation domain